MTGVNPVDGEDGPPPEIRGLLGHADQRVAVAELDGPGVEIGGIAGERVVVPEFAAPARGDESARDHGDVTLAGQACADVFLIAGIAETKVGLFGDGFVQATRGFLDIGLDFRDGHAFQTRAHAPS